jgi:hypothetical protein
VAATISLIKVETLEAMPYANVLLGHEAREELSPFPFPESSYVRCAVLCPAAAGLPTRPLSPTVANKALAATLKDCVDCPSGPPPLLATPIWRQRNAEKLIFFRRIHLLVDLLQQTSEVVEAGGVGVAQ